MFLKKKSHYKFKIVKRQKIIAIKNRENWIQDTQKDAERTLKICKNPKISWIQKNLNWNQGAQERS